MKECAAQGDGAGRRMSVELELGEGAMSQPDSDKGINKEKGENHKKGLIYLVC